MADRRPQDRDRPPLGNGREDFTGEEDLAYDPDDAPESQGRFTDDPFGRRGQGSFGDEDYDPSYQRGEEARDDELIGEEGPLRGLPADYEGPGRGQDGSEFATQEDEGSPEATTDALAETAPSADTLLRSDDGIREEIQERLADELELDPADVSVEVDDGIVVLRGTVDSLELRDAAADCAALVTGVARVANEIRVRDAEDPAVPA